MEEGFSMRKICLSAMLVFFASQCVFAGTANFKSEIREAEIQQSIEIATSLVDVRITEYPLNLELHCLKQDYLRMDNQSAENVSVYKTLVESNPKSAVALYLYGRILAQSGNFPESKKYIEKAILIDKNLSEGYAALASIASYKGDKFLANENIEKCLNINPESALGHYVKGLVLLSEKKYPEAAAEFERCILIDKYYVEAYFNLGMLLEAASQERRREAQTEKTLQNAAQATKLNTEADKLSLESAKYYQFTIDVRPTHLDAHVGAARMFESAGHEGFALDMLKRAAILEPDNRFVAKAVNRVGEIYKNNEKAKYEKAKAEHDAINSDTGAPSLGISAK